MSTQTAVIDIGYGNLRSVEKALAKVGGNPVVTADPEVVARAARVVVPGQGAFSDCVTALSRGGMEQALREFIATGRPYLGICLGLQVLYDESEEHGPARGLGLLPGRVIRFDPRPAVANADAAGAAPVLKIPHMGWNQVFVPPSAEARPDPLLQGIAPGSHFYFVHSYYVVPEDPDTIALTCEYGVEFTAAVRKDNLFACQFHPEKSQALGLRLLANFVEAE